MHQSFKRLPEKAWDYLQGVEALSQKKKWCWGDLWGMGNPRSGTAHLAFSQGPGPARWEESQELDGEEAAPGHFWPVLGHSGEEKGGSLVMGWVPVCGHSGVLTRKKDVLDFQIVHRIGEKKLWEGKVGESCFFSHLPFLPWISTVL